MVKIVIFVLLGAAFCAIDTWITRQGWKGKAILHEIDDGKQTAVVGEWTNWVLTATCSG
jgi:LPS O-antigen subunit length determinant protein (WzzB/FepE family)